MKQLLLILSVMVFAIIDNNCYSQKVELSTFNKGELQSKEPTLSGKLKLVKVEFEKNELIMVYVYTIRSIYKPKIWGNVNPLLNEE